MLYKACVHALEDIAQSLSASEESFEGSKCFRAVNLCDVIKNKSVQYDRAVSEGKGVSQNDFSVSECDRLDLLREDWYVFNDNYGTSEEKAFVAYFKTFVPSLRKKYDKVFLIRNERQLHLFSFLKGDRFEPDFIIILQKNKPCGTFERKICFAEPKGTNLIAADKWKEDFMLEMEEKIAPIEVDGNVYIIKGLHFFNRECRAAEFAEDMENL